MFITISIQNASVITIPSLSLISLRGSIREAMKDARNVIHDQEQNPFVANVFVFEIKEDAPKNIFDFKGDNFLVFKISKGMEEGGFDEVLLDDYRHLLWNHIGPSQRHKKASTGMFRVVIECDKQLFHIYKDVGNRHYAHSLCMKAVGGNRQILFQVYDDKGNSQIDESGELIELQPA